MIERTDTPILHVDMDAFYASVMTSDRPDLQQVPVVVGGGHRGVVLAANYAARRRGLHSAMPGVRARRLCPEAIFLAPDYARFTEVSRAVMTLFREITPQVEAVSLDEAFLDVGGAVRRLGTPTAIAERLRAAVHREQRITCSVGVAATISVAKVASRKAKPDGVVVVPPDRVAAWLHPMGVEDLYGVGEATRQRLRRMGIRTVGELAHTPLDRLREQLGAHLAGHLHTLAWGTDRREVTPGRAGVFGSGDGEPSRSMGAQRTFADDSADPVVLHRHLLALADGVTARMRRAGKVGRRVGLTVRFSDFETLTRSTTLAEDVDSAAPVHQAAVRLLDAVRGRVPRRRIRLLGVRVEGLRPRDSVHRQGMLGEPEHGWREVETAADAAVTRFGTGAVRRAALLAADRTHPGEPDRDGS